MADKHALAEHLSDEDQVSNDEDMIRLRELYAGAKLPTDSFDVAKDALAKLELLLKQRGIAYRYDDEEVKTATSVNTVRHRLENLLSENEEENFARRQKDEWREIADYMDLVARRGGSKS